jgi:hypothetical protein
MLLIPLYFQVLCWQHDVIGMLVIGKDWGECQDENQSERSKSPGKKLGGKPSLDFCKPNFWDMTKELIWVIFPQTDRYFFPR